jgi:rhodanese-related sulfurtransferase
VTEQTTASGLDFDARMGARRNGLDFIDREELEETLDRGEDFKLVMVLCEWAYRAKRIPRSLRVSTPEEGLQALDPNDEIVLYDPGPPCPASRRACRFLKAHGYVRVRRYVAGLQERESEGYPWRANRYSNFQRCDCALKHAEIKQAAS